MARVEVIYTNTRQQIHVTEIQSTAAWLRHLGDTARPCSRIGCKRPLGHGGMHYYNEDDYLNELQPLRAHRR